MPSNILVKPDFSESAADLTKVKEDRYILRITGFTRLRAYSDNLQHTKFKDTNCIAWKLEIATPGEFEGRSVSYMVPLGGRYAFLLKQLIIAVYAENAHNYFELFDPEEMVGKLIEGDVVVKLKGHYYRTYLKKPLIYIPSGKFKNFFKPEKKRELKKDIWSKDNVQNKNVSSECRIEDIGSATISDCDNRVETKLPEDNGSSQSEI